MKLGVAPSRLEGRTPRAWIRPDGDGWVVEAEPEFTRTDVALMSAAVEVERTTTERGFDIADEISEFADPGHPEATHYFRADSVPTFENHAVTALAEARKAWRDRNKGESDEGLIWTVEKIPIRRKQ